MHKDLLFLLIWTVNNIGAKSKAIGTFTALQSVNLAVI